MAAVRCPYEDEVKGADLLIDPWVAGQFSEINRKLDSLTRHVLSCLDAGEVDYCGQAEQWRCWSRAGHAIAPSERRESACSRSSPPGDADEVLDPDEEGTKGTAKARMVPIAMHATQVAGTHLPPSALASESEREKSFASEERSSPPVKQSRSPAHSESHSATLNGGLRSKLISQVCLALGRQRTRSALSEQIWKQLELPQFSRFSRFYHRLFLTLVAATIFLTLCQAFEVTWLGARDAMIMQSAIDSFFIVEVLVRFLTCPSFATVVLDPHTIIDVFASSPLAFRVAMGFRPIPAEGEGRQMRALFLGFLPLLRLLKTLRHNTKFHLLTKAFLLAFEALPVLVSFYFVIWLFFSTLIYALEPSLADLQDAMWLVVVSMTTLGYGDVVPTSGTGRVTIGLLVMASQMYMAIPLGILGSCFSQVWHDRDRHLLGHRVRGALQMHGFTVHDLPGMFKSFDRDQDGNLSFPDFRDMVEKLRVGLADERVLELFDHVDDDGSGEINCEEFIKFLSPSTHWQLYGQENTSVRLRAVTCSSSVVGAGSAIQDDLSI